jgi:translation initiation factor eIF-2B subunit delta
MTLKEYKAKIRYLMDDNIHGASFLESSLLQTFKQGYNDLRLSSFIKLIDYAEKWPTVMANLLNLIRYIKCQLKKSNLNIDILLDEHSKNIRISQLAIILKAAKQISNYNSIATISNSSMINSSINLAVSRGWRGMVFIPESRPILEGEILASELSGLPIKIIYGTDYQILSLLKNADAAFVGADAIDKEYFINKVGTEAMATVLGSHKTMYVIADLFKYYDGIENLEIEDMPSSEVWTIAPEAITIKNQYFEKIQIKENMVFVNEMGLHRKNEIKKYLEKRNT